MPAFEQQTRLPAGAVARPSHFAHSKQSIPNPATPARQSSEVASSFPSRLGQAVQRILPDQRQMKRLSNQWIEWKTTSKYFEVESSPGSLPCAFLSQCTTKHLKFGRKSKDEKSTSPIRFHHEKSFTCSRLIGSTSPKNVDFMKKM